MGRFYKTSKAKQLDYAFRFPTHLLAAAVAKKDQEIDQTLDEAEKLNTYVAEQKAKGKSSVGRGMYLPSDTEGYQTEVAGFEGEIDEITKEIMKNPFEASQQKGKIGDVRSRITASLTSGNLYTYNQNFNTAKDWLEKNKGVTSAIKNTAYQKAVDKWKSSTGDDGKYRMLSDYLPSTLYDEDIKDQAITYAEKTDRTRPVETRAGLIATNMYDDFETIQTVRQNLDLGLLTDDKGKPINPDALTVEEKEQAIREEIISQANNAAHLTQKIPKPTKDRAVKEGDKSYRGSGGSVDRPGTGLTQKTQISKLKDKYNTDNAIEAIDFEMSAINNALSEVDEEGKPMLNGAGYAKLTIEKGLLENKIGKAAEYANNQVAKAQADNPFKSPLESNNKNLNTDLTVAIYKKAFNDYFDKEQSGSIVNTSVRWSRNFTKNEQKQVVKDVETVVNDESLFNNKTLRSSNLALDGQSIEDLLTNGGIKRPIKNQDELDDNIATAENTKKEGTEITVTKSKDGSKQTVTFTDAEGDEQEYVSTIEYGKGYENFKLTSSEPIPTQIMDEQGNTMFRIGAMYKGKDDDRMKPTSLYVKQSDIGSDTYNDVLNRRQEDGSSLYYDNFGITLYNNLDSETEVGDEIPLDSDTKIIKTKDGLEIRMNDKIIANTPVGVKTYLKNIVTPKN